MNLHTMHPRGKFLSSSHNHRPESTNGLPPQANRTLMTGISQAIRTTIDCHHRLFITNTFPVANSVLLVANSVLLVSAAHGDPWAKHES